MNKVMNLPMHIAEDKLLARAEHQRMLRNVHRRMNEKSSLPIGDQRY